MKNLVIRVLAAMLVALMCVGLFACGGNNGPANGTTANTTGTQDPNKDPSVEEDFTGHKDPKFYTYNTYTSLSPSNWNELTYQDNNDTQIMSYIAGSFFSYDFKFDEEDQIVPGEFVMQYGAATKLEDVSAAYREAWNLPEGDGYAYKITIREDMKWDDGTAIDATDFVYTMQEQLDPLFQHYRADSFYAGSVNLVNAQNYVKQGQEGWFAADGPYAVYTAEELDSKIVFTLAPAGALTIGEETVDAEASFRAAMGFPASYDAAKTAAYLIANYLGGSAFTAEAAAAMEGKTMAEIKADATLKAAWDALIGWWQTEPNEELDFFVTYYTFPEVNFNEVGIFVGDNNYEIVIVLSQPLDLLKEDGSLSYKAAYNLSSLPLVHKATWEACKVAPAEGTTLWTTTYCTNVLNTKSWGPYKLESFQSGMQYVLVRNENWYGYNMDAYKGQYQTDRIVCDTVKEWNSAWLMFQKGQIDGIGIDVTIADDYKSSDRAYFTPDDFVGSLQLQSDATQLEARQTEGINKLLLTYQDFRKALSLSINRADYTAKCTTSSLAGFGLFNSMHYYDVENGGVYRNTDEGKKVLCEIYGVDYTQYEDLDAAVAAITGYDLDQARALVTKAYNEALAAGDIKEGDKVLLTFGTGAINESVQRHFDYIKAAWQEMAVGTPLEGKIDLELKDFAAAWANDFRAGAYDVCMGGWTGAAWDPGYFLLAYLDENYRYAAAWDTTKVMMTFTMKGVGENGADITETMSLMDWYGCLNGYSDAKYDWSSAALEESQRLQLIAALEKEVLKVYLAVPTYNSFGASLISYKVDYITYEYNTFMSYGGFRYMTFNFDDEAWIAEVEKVGGILNYK